MKRSKAQKSNLSSQVSVHLRGCVLQRDVSDGYIGCSCGGGLALLRQAGN